MPAEPAAAPAGAVQRAVPTVLVVTASMGAGHDTAARTLAAGLRGRGVRPEVVDWLEFGGGQGAALRGLYRGMLDHAPASYELAMRGWARWPRGFERITAAGGGRYRRALLDLVDRHQPAAVVATYNLAGQLLGRLRAAGELRVPVVVAVTDAGPHPYWYARGADLHLAPLEVTAAAMRGYGADPVEVTAPLVDRSSPVPDRTVARARWGLDPDDRVALVSGGAWGVGAVAAAATALAADGTVPVVLCGRSPELLRRVGAVRGARAVSWTAEVPTLLAAADVVVDSGGGATAWEALAVDRPLVLHRVIPGHGRLNAATLTEQGLSRTSGDERELVAAVRAAASGGSRGLGDAVFAAPAAADAVLALLRRSG